MSGILIDKARAEMERAQGMAFPAVTGFKVGAAVLGASGALVPGCNVEFAGGHPNATLHAEQTALANAWARGETRIDAIYLTAAPCGHCRQFMCELPAAHNLKVHDLSRGEEGVELGALLPSPFGPEALGIEDRFLGVPYPHRPGRKSGDMTDLAFEARNASHAPYTGSAAGACVVHADGRRYTGAAIESVAMNPSVGPLHMALAVALLDGADIRGIVAAALVDTGSAPFSYADVSEAALRACVGDIRLKCAEA